MITLIMIPLMMIMGFESAFAHFPNHFGVAAYLQEFPPSPGTYFATSILQWSFGNHSFWRIPDMATVLDIAKSITLVGWRDAPWLQGQQTGNPRVQGCHAMSDMTIIIVHCLLFIMMTMIMSEISGYYLYLNWSLSTMSGSCPKLVGFHP